MKNALIDFSNFCYSVYFSGIYILNHKWDGDKQPTEKMLGNLALGKLNRIRQKVGHKTHIIFVLDAGRGNKEALIGTTYKANRTKLSMNPIPIIARYMYNKGHEFRYTKGEEADDVIATLSQQLDGEKIVVTSDQDMWQLVNKSTKILHMNKLEYMNRDDLVKRYGLIRWKNVVRYKAIFGDSSDNIPSIVPRLRKQPIIDLLNKNYKVKAICKQLNKNKNLGIDLEQLGNRIKAIKLKKDLVVSNIKSNKKLDYITTYKDKYVDKVKG